MLLTGRQFQDAEARADKALAIDPKLADAQLLKANALAGLRKFDDAVGEAEEAIRLNPQSVESYANLGAMQQVRGDVRAAEAAFRRATQAAPESVEARLSLANFLWTTGAEPKQRQSSRLCWQWLQRTCWPIARSRFTTSAPQAGPARPSRS